MSMSFVKGIPALVQADSFSKAIGKDIFAEIFERIVLCIYILFPSFERTVYFFDKPVCFDGLDIRFLIK